MNNATKQFLADYKLGFRVERVDSRPDALAEWDRDARHWRYEFRSLDNDAHIAGYFSQGSAHFEDPTAGEVIESLSLDSMSYANAVDVLEFAAEFGYDLDDYAGQDRARKVYSACALAHSALETMLGDKGLRALWDVPFDEEDPEPEDEGPTNWFGFRVS